MGNKASHKKRLFEDCKCWERRHEAGLLAAAQLGHHKCLQILIQVGADVNSLCEALLVVAQKGHDKCLDLLIKAGANVNKLDKGDQTSLMFAAQNGHDKCVKLLIRAGTDVNKQGMGYTALIAAAQHGHEKCVELLIQAGADVNSNSDLGYTALMKAAENGHIKCVVVLIQAGADVNKQSRQGYTALMRAAKDGHKWILVQLMRAGAYVNKYNWNGHNALRFHIYECGIRRESNKEVCMLLFAAGEAIDGATVDRVITVPVPDYLLHKDLKLNLKQLTREAIRKHLINIDPHQHLFGRIPQLGLPSSLTAYLLYNVSCKMLVW